MRSLALVLMLAAVFIGLGTVSTAAQRPPPLTTTTISGGDLPHPLQLAAADHEAFMRRLDLPPLLDDEQELGGKSYTITSPYWDIGVRAGDNTQFVVEEAATYYPEGGFVRTDQNGETVWTALDTTQKAIVDRYIRYASVLPEKPSIFEVLRAAGLANEQIGISIGSVNLTPEQRSIIWNLVKDLEVQSASTTPIDPSDQRLTWIVFSLPSGRAIPMAYSSATNFLVEPTEATEGKRVLMDPQWLVAVLGEQARDPTIGPLAPLTIPSQEGAGSPIWWLIMFGGGVVAIAAAVVVQRQIAKAPLKGHDAASQESKDVAAGL